MAPEKIGRYEIRAELGRGGMATVYHGYDPRFEREVAVKVLPAELMHSDPQFKLRFEREAKIIAQLEHPSIVPVYDVGDENGQPYFVMRYMNGGSLSDRMREGLISIPEAAKILGQIAPGLDEAHSKGIVHRDLKPSNILFDNKNIPYISDFGIAKLSRAQVSNVTGSGIIGTPAYMAPEQASGETVDGRSDIYAVGIILFEMLTGRQPYEADTPMAVAVKHITDPVPRILDANPGLPPDVEDIIQVAMAKKKDDRFSTTVELVEALQDIGPDGKTISGKTRAMRASQKTVAANINVGKASGKRGLSAWAIIVPILLLALAAGGYYVYANVLSKPATETPLTAPPVTDVPVAPPSTEETSGPGVTTEPPQETPVPTETSPAVPARPVLGGADLIAFVANSEIWLMNVDGSELRQVTSDGATKNDLQWMKDGETLLFLSGKTIKYYNVNTDVVDTLTSFPSSITLDGFQLSHDNSMVMVAMSSEIFVVPFDFEQFKTFKLRSDFFAMGDDACILPVAGTKAALAVQEVRWSFDDKLVAWKYKGVGGNTTAFAEQVSVFDVTACDEEKIDLKDNFPGSRFNPVGYQSREIPDFDWDGRDLFFFNTSRRNDGWGEFYIYNWVTHRPTLLYPKNSCCYRDARFSPDGTYLIFTFQSIEIGPGAPTEMYYVAVGELETGANFQPFDFGPDFFKNPKEGTQAALRPVQP